MQYKILKPQSTEGFQIEKRKAGSIRIDLWATLPISAYLITEFGYSKLIEAKKILLSQSIFKVDSVMNIAKVISLSSGTYYFVVTNKNNSDVSYNFDISENFEPPGYSSVTGTSGTFIR